MKKLSLPTLALASAIIAGAGLNANASVDMTFTWSGTLYQTGYANDSYNGGGALLQGADAVGIYKFVVSPNQESVPNPLYSVCLSPAGLLDGNTHTYNVKSFSAANPGIFPSGWASGVVGNQTQYWGIQNASYLWNTFGMNIVNGTAGQAGNSNARAAALELAIWSSLYNSTAYGALGGTKWTTPTMDATTLGYFNADLLALTTAGSHIPLYTGNILEGTGAPGDGPGAGDDQEFLVLGTPVPEPTTVIAGALLLLPFGASTLRMMRKRRQA